MSGAEEANKAVVVRALQAIDDHDRVAVEALFGAPHVGAVFDVIDSYPDVTVDLEWMTAEGAKVTSWIRLRGTHLGTWQGIEPTGRAVDVCVSITFEVREGRLMDFWYAADTLGWYQQLGFELQENGS